MSNLNRKPTESGDRIGTPRRLTRRRFAVGGSVVVLSLAGCAGSPAESGQANGTTTEANTTQAGVDQAVQSFAERIAGENIAVESVSYRKSHAEVELTYRSADPTSNETVTTEIGTITGEFYNSVDAGLTADRLNATVLDPDGSAQITWYAEQAWYRDFKNGEITANELTLRVVETAEGKDG